MKKLTYLFTELTLILVQALFAKTDKQSTQAPPFTSTGEGPMFYMDCACFKGVASKTYTEFYFQVGYDYLQFIKDGHKFKAGYELDFSVLDNNQNCVQEFHSSDSFYVNDFDETVSRRKARVSQVGYSLEPGQYTIRMVVKDLETLYSSFIDKPVSIRSFNSPELQLSDIQFSQKIKLAEDGDVYVKNKRYIEPNAIRTFAHGLADIFIYFEIYNLSAPATNTNSLYSALITIFDENGKQVGQINRSHQKPGIDVAHSLRLPVDDFLNGNYTLNIQATDEDGKLVAKSSKEFTVLSWPVTYNDYDFEE